MAVDELTKLFQEADALIISLDALLITGVECNKKIPLTDHQQFDDQLTCTLKSQVSEAILKRSDAYVDAVYSKYAADDRGISHSEYFKASQEIRFDFTNEDDADALFENMDMDNDGFLNLDEFRRAVQSSSEMEQFLSHSLSVIGIISAALPRDDSRPPIEVFRMLTPAQITAVSNAVADGLVSVITEKIARLNKGFAAAEAKKAGSNSAAKFAIFDLSAGSIQDYHKGLSSRVGDSLYIALAVQYRWIDLYFLFYFFAPGAPDLSFQKAMYTEHCLNKGCDFEFETSNYHIKTTAKREWDVVVHNEPLAPSEAGHGRKVPALGELELLPLSKKANLCLAEIIALIMYTGPMVFCCDIYCLFWEIFFDQDVSVYGLQCNFETISAISL